jgi:hypothetical protein
MEASPVAGAEERRLGAVRMLTIVLALAVVLGAIVGVRSFLAHRQADSQSAAIQAATSKPFPTSASIEATWGIRFTAVRLIDDAGDVEIRYTAVDAAKTGRLHSGNAADLPFLRGEDNGAEIHSNSLMLNLHSSHAGDDIVGGSYSMIYGNSNGVLHYGQLVTLVLADGLQLQHIPVQ